MKKYLLITLVLAATVLAACSSSNVNYYVPSTEASPEVLNLAVCLTENDAVMYGTEWCPHCRNQKELFGDAFINVTYVNCEVNPSACNAAGVQAFPTWVINGQRYTGTQALATLSQNSGCPLVPA